MWIAKKAWNSLQLVWARITFNRVTTVYTLNALCYCIVQVLCQVSLWNMNLYAGDLGKAIMAQASLSPSNFAYLEPNTGIVRICNGLDESLSPEKFCQVVSIPAKSPLPLAPRGGERSISTLSWPSPFKKRYVGLSALTQPNSAEVTGVKIVGLHGDHFASGPGHELEHQKDVMIADLKCVQAMKWPIQILLQGKREDVLLTSFQIWVLGMSLVAVLNESIPHIFGAYIAHFVASLWSALQIYESVSFKRDYVRAIVNGACDGVDFLPEYFGPRITFGIAMVVINFLALFSSGFLTYKLFYLFGWNTFKRIGASVVINYVYKLALTLSIVIQLSLFFIVSAMGLWIDQVYSGLFAPRATQITLYKGVYIVAFILLLPWLSLGWFAVRREHRTMMLVFLILTVYLLGGWIAMCFSHSFQLTFVHWKFFLVIWCIAFILVLLTTGLGVLCRLNFGKGLAEYLKQMESGDDGAFTELRPDPDTSSLSSQEDKIGFPSESDALPQFMPPAPPPMVPSKLSFYRKWGRSDKSRPSPHPRQMPPMPNQMPPMPPAPSTQDSLPPLYDFDLEKDGGPARPDSSVLAPSVTSESHIATYAHSQQRDTTYSTASTMFSPIGPYGSNPNGFPSPPSFPAPSPPAPPYQPSTSAPTLPHSYPAPPVQRSETAYTSYTQHRMHDSMHTVATYMSTGLVDPGMEMGMERGDTIASGNSGVGVSRNKSTSSVRTMKTGTKPTTWMIE